MTEQAKQDPRILSEEQLQEMEQRHQADGYVLNHLWEDIHADRFSLLRMVRALQEQIAANEEHKELRAVLTLYDAGVHSAGVVQIYCERLDKDGKLCDNLKSILYLWERMDPQADHDEHYIERIRAKIGMLKEDGTNA